MNTTCTIFRRAALAASAFILASSAWADHGPGTSGGGMSVQSAEVLNPSAFSLDIRWDYTRYESLSESAIFNKTMKIDGEHAHFDALRQSMMQTLSLWYGVSEKFQVGASAGWYRGGGLREGHVHHDGSFGYHELGDVAGMTDPWIYGKYRLHKGPGGSWALFGGAKLPWGRDDARGRGEEEPLEPSVQPGSGAFDFMLGLAYSRWLTAHASMDASAQYTIRTANDSFRMGDRFDGGVALAWRFTENVQTFPQPAVFAELTLRQLGANREDGEKTVNSGGAVLFFSPGFRCAFNKRFALSASLQFPLLQDWRSEQQETRFKASIGATFSF